jgi:predicted Co/Zn/Cd cation transporter (cation efflux family)
MDTTAEQRVLKQSIAATLVVGTSCVLFGLWAAARSIMFDGVYSLLDVVLTLGSLVVNAGAYADSLVLVVLALVMLPVPAASCVRALREVLQIAPRDLDRRVRDVLDTINARHGLAGYRSFVARTGRIALVEVHFRVPLDLPLGNIRTLDAIRRDARSALHEPHLWLTINFAGSDAEPLSWPIEAA